MSKKNKRKELFYEKHKDEGAICHNVSYDDSRFNERKRCICRRSNII